MAVSKCYRPNVDYTAADQVEVTSSPTNSKPAFIPATKLVDATNVAVGTASNPLVTGSSGLEYETVAASQTAQVLGPTGATGDYLSHVVLQPTTTGAGTTTILDNATVIFTFTTGTLPGLSPITVPIGANSVSGAWKITTGANITATAFGNFT